MTSAPRRSAEAALLALLLASSPLAAAAQARQSDRVLDLQQGLFCAPPEAGRREAPDTLAGWIHVPDEPVAMVAEGRVAAAVLGQGFGVRFLLDGFDLVGVRFQVTHPPMGDQGVTRQGWDSLSQGGEWDAIFFQFDEPEELLPGTWTFTAHDGDQELFHIPFTVVPPEAAPELARLCQGGAMLSLLR